MVELTTTTSVPEQTTNCPCWHVLQPNTIAWPTFLDHLESAGLQFSKVSREEWLVVLKNSNPDPEVNREWLDVENPK